MTAVGAPVGVPPVLYVPTRGRATADEAVIQFRHGPDGQLGLLAYTSVDQLVDGCGEGQPWVMIPISKLDALKAQQDFEGIFLDVALPAEERVDRV